MKYDFDTPADRQNVGAYKWETIPKIMGEGNDDVIPMFIADMDFPIMPEIAERVRELAGKGIYGYTVPTERYYESIISWMERHHNWVIQKEWITVSAGVVPAICSAIRAFTEPEDKVIIQQPVYYPFMKSILANGRKISNNGLLYEGGRYTIDFEDLEERAKDSTAKVLLFCSPHNPVGRVWTEEELEKVIDICLRNNVIIFSDEIHFDLVYPPNKHRVMASLSREAQNRSIIFTAPSKTFNLAGLQCSNIIIADPRMREAYREAVSATGFFSLNSFAYESCITAYEKGEAWYKELLSYLQGNIKYIEAFIGEYLPQIKIAETQGTYLAWLDFREMAMTSDELKNFMRKKARIYPNEGAIFGKSGEGFERVNVACPRSFVVKAMENLRKAVNEC